MPTLTNAQLTVVLDDRSPRILSLSRRESGAFLAGCPADQPFSVELNGTLYTQPDLACAVTAETERARYHLRVESLALTLHIEFALHGDQVHITLPQVQEEGAFRLETLYFPDHRLVSGTARQGDSYLRLAGWRFNWSVGWLSGGEALDFGSERFGPVIDSVPERGAVAAQHACVWNPGVCAVLLTSIWANPLVTSLDSYEATAPGRAGRFSIWADTYAYRLRGELAEPFHLTLAVLGDYDGNGRIDWCDAANWEGDQRIRGTYPYEETILYKLFLDDKKRARPNFTFAECLDVIRLIHQVSGGLRQIVYLVGWQHEGHDTGFPHPQSLNPRLGGPDALRQLIQDAKAYNCTVSVHANVDDAYETEPGYDPALLARAPDGTPIMWFYNSYVDRPCYSVNHTLSVETGKARQWIDDLLTLTGAVSSIHLDAFRPTNETWLSDGTYISMESEYQRGLAPIVRMFRERGVDVTTEGPLLNLVYWTWLLPDWRHHYYTVLLHGRMGGFNRITGGYHRRHDPVGDGLGNGFVWEESEHADRRSALIYFYENWMYDQILRRKRMTGYRVGDWLQRAEAQYADSTVVRTGSSYDELYAEYEGIPVARGRSRFLPWRPDMIYSFSRDGGSQEWLLPPSWAGKPVQAVILGEAGESLLPVTVDGRRICFDAPPCEAVSLTCEAVAQ